MEREGYFFWRRTKNGYLPILEYRCRVNLSVSARLFVFCIPKNRGFRRVGREPLFFVWSRWLWKWMELQKDRRKEHSSILVGYTKKDICDMLKYLSSIVCEGLYFRKNTAFLRWRVSESGIIPVFLFWVKRYGFLVFSSDGTSLLVARSNAGFCLWVVLDGIAGF